MDILWMPPSYEPLKKGLIIKLKNRKLVHGKFEDGKFLIRNSGMWVEATDIKHWCYYPYNLHKDGSNPLLTDMMVIRTLVNRNDALRAKMKEMRKMYNDLAQEQNRLINELNRYKENEEFRKATL